MKTDTFIHILRRCRVSLPSLYLVTFLSFGSNNFDLPLALRTCRSICLLHTCLLCLSGHAHLSAMLMCQKGDQNMMMIVIGLWPSQVGRRLELLSRATMAPNEMGLRVDGRRGQWSRRPALKIFGIFSRQESRTFLASLRGSHTGSIHICTRRRLLY